MKGKITTLVKNFFPEAIYYLLLIVPVFIALVFLAFQNTNIGFLQLHSIDDYVFQGSLRHMLDSVLTGNLSGLFGYGFYQYGFIYFFANLLISFPGLLVDNFVWSIAAPRLVTSFFAVGALILIYKFTRLHTGSLTALIFAIIFVTMPAFWFNATWFHPDWPMTFFLLTFIYYLTKDNWQFGKNFNISIICLGLAIAFKYQALTVLPIIIIYIFYDHIKIFTFKAITLSLKRFLISIISVVVIFVLCNPYIIHPLGWKVFTGAFFENMKSNATNHGSNTTVSIIEKISFAVSDYYVNVIFLFILILASFYLTKLFFKEKEKSIFFIIAINFIVNFSYLIFFVNKAWQIYYLPVITLGLLSLIYFVKNVSIPRQKFILCFIAVVQLATYTTSYYPILSTSRDAKAPDFNTYSNTENIAINDFIVSSLKNHVNTTTSVLLTPYTAFNFDHVDLSYEQVRFIYGALDRSSFDSESYLAGQKAYWGDLKTDAVLLESFKPVSIIILRKDIPFINAKESDLDIGLQESNKIVSELYDGSLGYIVLNENEQVVIFNKK